MDDLELEARLRTHLHRRFDGATPTPELTAAVTQIVTTEPRRIGLPSLRRARPRLGWSAVVAMALIAVVAVGGLRLGGFIGPGAASPTPQSTVTAPSQRQFIVLPPGSGLPSKAESSLAADILNARVRALGIGNFTSAVGNAIQFMLPADGPSDATIRFVIGAAGDVEFVPLPAEDYGPGGLTAEVGDPLPKDEPALFGWEGIASARRDDSRPATTLVVTLKPAAAQAFGDYTASHVGEAFAVLVDGEVALLPTIQDAIPGGEVAFSGPSAGDRFERFERAMAIIVGGPLPERWVPATVPEIVQQDAIVAKALREQPGATLVSADLDAIQRDARWLAVWRIALDGEFRECIPGPSGNPSCLEATSMEFIVNAETGDQISSRSLNE